MINQRLKTALQDYAETKKNSRINLKREFLIQKILAQKTIIIGLIGLHSSLSSELSSTPEIPELKSHRFSESHFSVIESASKHHIELNKKEKQALKKHFFATKIQTYLTELTKLMTRILEINKELNEEGAKHRQLLFRTSSSTALLSEFRDKVALINLDLAMGIDLLRDSITPLNHTDEIVKMISMIEDVSSRYLDDYTRAFLEKELWKHGSITKKQFIGQLTEELSVVKKLFHDKITQITQDHTILEAKKNEERALIEKNPESSSKGISEINEKLKSLKTNLDLNKKYFNIILTAESDLKSATSSDLASTILSIKAILDASISVLHPYIKRNSTSVFMKNKIDQHTLIIQTLITQLNDSTLIATIGEALSIKFISGLKKSLTRLYTDLFKFQFDLPQDPAPYQADFKKDEIVLIELYKKITLKTGLESGYIQQPVIDTEAKASPSSPLQQRKFSRLFGRLSVTTNSVVETNPQKPRIP